MAQDSIGRYITSIARHLTLFINRKLEAYHMTNGQYLFFVTIWHNEGVCQEHLSQMLKIDKITTSKAVKRLVDEGYVRKERDLNDKRYWRLYLTAKGNALAPIVYEVLKETTTILASDLSDEQGQQVRELLRHMLENIAQYT